MVKLIYKGALRAGIVSSPTLEISVVYGQEYDIPEESVASLLNTGNWVLAGAKEVKTESVKKSNTSHGGIKMNTINRGVM
jgi:hypothetical protein